MQRYKKSQPQCKLNLVTSGGGGGGGCNPKKTERYRKFQIWDWFFFGFFFWFFSVFFGFSILANFDWFNGFLLSGSFG